MHLFLKFIFGIKLYIGQFPCPSSGVFHCTLVHTAMVYVIEVCWQLASRIRTERQFRPDPALASSLIPDV